MMVATRTAWDDKVLLFGLGESGVRGRIVRLGAMLDRILGQHDYPPQIEALVAEMTLLTVLIGQAIKLRWRLSLQVQSKGPVRMIATDCYAPSKAGGAARIRAYASYDGERLVEGTPFSLIGEGYFALLIHQGRDARPFRGFVPIAGTSLSDCAEAYFAQSEQLPTRFVTESLRTDKSELDSGWYAGGIMVQRGSMIAPSGGRVQGAKSEDARVKTDGNGNWDRINLRLDQVAPTALASGSLSPMDLLVHAFRQEGLWFQDGRQVSFGCTCSKHRVRQSLSIYSDRDIETMTTRDGYVTAGCRFCGAHYKLDPATVGLNATGREIG